MLGRGGDKLPGHPRHDEGDHRRDYESQNGGDERYRINTRTLSISRPLQLLKPINNANAELPCGLRATSPPVFLGCGVS